MSAKRIARSTAPDTEKSHRLSRHRRDRAGNGDCQKLSVHRDLFLLRDGPCEPGANVQALQLPAVSAIRGGRPNVNHLAASLALVLSGTALDRGVGAFGRVDRDQGALEAMFVALRRALLFETGLVQGEGPVMEAEIGGLSVAFALPCLNSLTMPARA